MIKSVYIKNYHSIVEATVNLAPFTLLIGANGTGKSNFLRLFSDLSKIDSANKRLTKHYNNPGDQRIIITQNDGSSWERPHDQDYRPYSSPNNVKIFSINPDNIGIPEQLKPNPTINEDGSGAVQVLDALKTGDREDLFDQIENDLKRYIPEIEKLSFIPNTNSKQLQVREKHMRTPVPVAELSEGTRLVLTILTIVYQENPPTFIGLEEIDRGLHPRLFQQILELLFEITEEKDVQIVATTHNPYLVDEFKDREDSVIIVEKQDGATTFTSLAEKSEGLSIDQEPLGHLWYSGFVGGCQLQSNELPLSAHRR